MYLHCHCNIRDTSTFLHRDIDNQVRCWKTPRRMFASLSDSETVKLPTHRASLVDDFLLIVKERPKATVAFVRRTSLVFSSIFGSLTIPLRFTRRVYFPNGLVVLFNFNDFFLIGYLITSDKLIGCLTIGFY